jgi:membrane protein implicated in regulation of membrane protease activity
MANTHKNSWRRPVDRLDLVIGGLMIFCLLSLATLAGAGVISEDWIPRFLLGWLVACAVLCVLAKFAALVLARLLRRLNVPDNQPMQRTGDDGPVQFDGRSAPAADRPYVSPQEMHNADFDA